MPTYENIPGVEMQVNDGQLLIAEDATTPRMLVIAPVPVGAKTVTDEPVLVRDEAELVRNTGGYFVNGVANQLAANWRALQDLGNRRTWLMPLTGVTAQEKFTQLHSRLFGYMADFSVDHVVLDGAYVEEEVEGLTASMFENPEDKAAFPHIPGIQTRAHFVEAGGYATFPLVVTLGTNDTLTLVDKQTTTPADVVLTIGAKTYANISEVADALQVELRKKVGFSKAAVVVSGDKLAILTETAFALKSVTGLAGALGFMIVEDSVLEDHPAGVIIKGSFALLLSDYAKVQSTQNNATLAYIATRPVSDTSLAGVKAHVDGLVARKNEYSAYLQVVAGPEVAVTLPGSLRLHFLSGVAHYAGLVSTLAPESAPTNKAIPKVNRIRFNFSLAQINALVGAKYVTFRIRNGRLIVTDGVTTAPNLTVGVDSVPSDFKQLSTLRITNYMAQVVRNVAERFIGEPNRMPMYNALNAAIKGEIDAAIAKQAIQDARFSVVSGQYLDTAIIKMEILPQFELRKIPVTIALATPDGFNGRRA